MKWRVIQNQGKLILDTAAPRLHPRLSLHSQMSLLRAQQSRSCTKLWCGVIQLGFVPQGLEVQGGNSCQCEALSTLSVGKPAHTHSLLVESRVLQPSYLSQQFSQQPRYFISSEQDRGTGKPTLWLDPLTPQGKGLLFQNFSSFQIPPRVGGPNFMLFFCPTQSHGNLSCSFCYMGIFLPVSSQFYM